MNKILFILTLSILASNVFAEPERKAYPNIYPFVPFDVDKIISDSERMTEDKNFVGNIFDIQSQGLNSGKSENQPWMSTYWPLNKGLIADPYKSKFQVFKPRKELSWRKNYDLLTKRKFSVHKYADTLSESALNMLAPSEKYDLLLGDSSFDLTNRLRVYMKAWGEEKEHAFLSSRDKVGGLALDYANELMESGKYKTFQEALDTAIELRGGIADYMAQDLMKRRRGLSFEKALEKVMKKAIKEQNNYVLKKQRDSIALWEGICHGWSTAAGIVPRPLNAVNIKLHDGRNLRFYPSDLKALVSLLWANSLIQDSKFEYKDKETGKNVITGGILMQGLRCNEKRPKSDEWGRFYDHRKDVESGKIEPRCVGVHPAVWHISLANIIGKQKRSFVVERKVKASVDNHPMSEYKFSYFNPNTGRYGALSDVIVPLNGADQFYKFRAKETKYIVGVKTTMTYIDWKRPGRSLTDHEKYDFVERIPMLYDLELDEDGNIIGGQWRTKEVGKRFLNIKANHGQPDFFWAVTKDWKKTGYFNEYTNVSKWEDTSIAPPSDWLNAAKVSHAFIYEQTRAMGWNKKCKVIHKKTKEVIKIPCELRTNRPQPMINVVNKLIELSRK